MRESLRERRKREKEGFAACYIIVFHIATLNKELILIHLINRFFFFGSLLNVTQSTSDESYLCVIDKEGFSTGKR